MMTFVNHSSCGRRNGTSGAAGVLGTEVPGPLTPATLLRAEGWTRATPLPLPAGSRTEADPFAWGSPLMDPRSKQGGTREGRSGLTGGGETGVFPLTKGPLPAPL